MSNIVELPSIAIRDFSYHDLIADGLTDDEIIEIISELDEKDAAAIFYDWHFWARESQRVPNWDWRVWVLKGGRGSGKTWTGANWFNEQAKKYPRLALVGRTASDVRDVMVLGESGLIAVSHPNFRPEYEPGKRRVTWPNGAEALCFSADEPNVLRGPQYYKAWADEVAAWRKIKETWDNLMFGLRLGDSPQCVVTTTPRPIKEFKEILARRTTHVTTESTLNNVNNLAPQWAEEVITIYQGTRLGQQELDGRVLDDNPNALWTQAVIDDNRVHQAPDDLDRIVVGVDPPSADNDNKKDVDRVTADCGIVVAGRKGLKTSAKSQCYILDDLTLEMPQPEEWAKQAVTAFRKFKADCIIAEANNGGAMVKSTIQAIDPNVPVEIVYASRGKAIRAEPVSTLYQGKRVHHFGQFSELEDQLTGWEPGMKSPDRLDACVWAVSDLMVGESDKPVKMLVAAGGRKADLTSGQFPLTPSRPEGYGILNGR